MKKLALALLASTTLVLGACGGGDSEPPEHEVMANHLLSDIDADEVSEECRRLRMLEMTVREAYPKGATMLQLQERLEDIQQGSSVEDARLRMQITPDVDIEEVYEHMIRGLSALCA